MPESTATAGPAPQPLDLDPIEAAHAQDGLPLVYGTVQIAGLNGVSYRLADDDVVDLSIHNGPAGHSCVTLRGPAAELKVIVALLDGALDRADRETGPVPQPG